MFSVSVELNNWPKMGEYIKENVGEYFIRSIDLLTFLNKSITLDVDVVLIEYFFIMDFLHVVYLSNYYTA